MSRGKKILVTGGAGYIGSHTIIELVNAGFEVVSIDNFSNSFPQTFDRIQEISGVRVPNANIDLTDQEATAAFLSEHNDLSGIIHFAALKAVGESVEKPLKYYQNNLGSLINLLNGCAEAGIKHFIFSSSCTVYGDVDHLPATEQTPLKKQSSPYGHTKYVGEQIIEQFAQTQSGFGSIALRYFNPVGAHMSGLNGEIPIGRPENLLPIVTQTAIGVRESFTIHGNDYPTADGTCIRDYIHVSDIAKAHLLALQKLIEAEQPPAFDIYNLGSGNGVSVQEIIDSFERVSDTKLNYSIGPRRQGDVMAIYADNSKARNELGWIPQQSLDDMLSSAWQWEQYLRKNNDWAS